VCAFRYSHLGIQYFPLGGINAENMRGYLARKDVPAVGGSWIVQADLVAAADWDAITARAADVIKHLAAIEADQSPQ
jgi:2-dehydro-3-deoxyphosphogluconate aldolase/(4S)-4-hydroxy-2-oxoglutarate aldolase